MNKMVDFSNQVIVNRALNGNEGATVFAIAKWVALTGIVVALLATSVGIRDQILNVQYKIEELTSANKNLSEQNDLLRAELQSLTTPARLEKAAHDLGLISANDDRVLILESDGYEKARDKVAHWDNRSKALHE
ncbi:MAG: septum formation initiator family protein [Acidobacteriota bacterium]